MMKLKHLIVYLLISIALISNTLAQPAQKTKRTEGKSEVHGKIIDDDSQKPLGGVKVALHRSADSTVLGGTFTKGNGTFELKKIPDGKFYLSLSMISYEDKNIDVKELADGATVDIGSINYKVSSVSTQDVVVIAKKETMQFDAEKKIINVDKNALAAGGSALDVLQTTPSVSVDFDGNVSLRGSSAVNILIDGQQQPTSGSSRIAQLEQIAASDIESIEIINNPSAKYSPEGVGGIINIIRKNRQNLGFNGVIGLSAGTHEKFNGNLSMNYGIQGVNFFLNTDSREDNRWIDVTNNRTAYIHNDTSYLFQKMNMNRYNFNQSLRTGVEFFLSKLDYLKLEYNLNYSVPHRPKDIYAINSNSQHDVISNMDTRSTEDGPDRSNNISMNYTKKFPEKDRQLKIDMSYSMSASTNINDRTINTANYDSNNVATMLDPALSRIYTENHAKTFLFKANYAHPIEQGEKIETGVDINVRNIDNLYDYANYLKPENVFIHDTSLYNNFNYQEHIYAGYVTFNNHIDDFSYQIGARLENATIRSEQRVYNSAYSYNYTSLFPNMNLKYDFDKQNSMHFSFNRRINRPNLHDLNPFREIDNPQMVQFGNPYLKPEYINSYELAYSKTYDDRTVIGSLYWRHYNNVIKRFSYIDTVTGIQNLTSANFDDANFIGVELIDDEVLNSWWKMNETVSIYKNMLGGNQALGIIANNNISWNFKLNASFQLMEGLAAQTFIKYDSPMITPQGTINPIYSIDIALRKDLFDEKATLTLKLSDVFKTNKFNIDSYGAGFISNSDRRRETQVAQLTFTYRINSNAKKNNQRRKNNNNDNEMQQEQEREN